MTQADALYILMVVFAYTCLNAAFTQVPLMPLPRAALAVSTALGCLYAAFMRLSRR